MLKTSNQNQTEKELILEKERMKNEMLENPLLTENLDDFKEMIKEVEQA